MCRTCAQVVHGYSIPGINTRHSGLDIVVIRENTEGEYSGLGE
jgi:isocitrate dehydrogenase (NAD+)